MDKRWLKILVERGRIRLAPLPSEGARAKYRRAQDLLKLPRDPDEKAAHLDLAIRSEDVPPLVREIQSRTIRHIRSESEPEYEKLQRHILYGYR